MPLNRMTCNIYEYKVGVSLKNLHFSGVILSGERVAAKHSVLKLSEYGSPVDCIGARFRQYLRILHNTTHPVI
jgi:hypothetical protein